LREYLDETSTDLRKYNQMQVQSLAFYSYKANKADIRVTAVRHHMA
jgi:hypothetical protein